MCHSRRQFAPESGPHDRSLRAADHDRDAVADTLREQHLAGRLDTDELQERLERCYSARTYADLDAVLADLPAEVPDQTGGRRPSGPAWPVPRLAWLIPLLVLAIALSHGYLVWLVIPFFFWFGGRRWRWRSTI